MKDNETKNNKKSLEEQAKKRIKTGLILNAFGEKNKIKVTQTELNAEFQKQFRMMPGQEKIVKEYYEKNPAAIESLRGSIYEEKIIEEIKKIAKTNKKEISMEEAAKILKAENDKLSEPSHLHDHNHNNNKKPETKKVSPPSNVKKTKTISKKKKLAKKVSKK